MSNNGIISHRATLVNLGFFIKIKYNYFVFQVFMKKVLAILWISLLAPISAYADVAICETKSWYELYECRTEKICWQYENKESVYTSSWYLDASEYLNILDTRENWAFIVLDEVKSEYRKNMNTIYSCAMIQTQLNTLEGLIGELLKDDETGQLSGIIKNRIDIRTRKLEAAAEKLKCNRVDTETIYNKQNINRQTTHEVCMYSSYLEYLREYYGNIPNILWLDTSDTTDWNEDNIADVETVEKAYTTSNISRLIQSVGAEIDEEIEHTYKVFPIAFQAYTEYENNYPLHFLLEIIREDFVLLRRSFHESLMPIAQVGYKIINAMIR